MKINYDIFKVEKKYAKPRKGRVLISEPFLHDDYFKRSVVFLAEHSEEGTVGFVLNKSIDNPVHKLINNFPAIDSIISLGGPVSTDTIHYIHNLGDMIPGSMHITDNIYWGGEFKIIKEMIVRKVIKKNQIRFFLGHSGWEAGQLEYELSNNSWVVTDIPASRIMKVIDVDEWKDILETLGDKYTIWANAPESPHLN